MSEAWRHIPAGNLVRSVDGIRVVLRDEGWTIERAPDRALEREPGKPWVFKNKEDACRMCDFGAFQPGVPPLYEFPDDAGLPALLECIRHMHSLEATWLESVPVKETHEGQTVWEGEVQVFAVEHPRASRVYAWSHETTAGKRRFHAVLGQGPVTGATEAVRVAIAGDEKRRGEQG